MVSLYCLSCFLELSIVFGFGVLFVIYFGIDIMSRFWPPRGFADHFTTKTTGSIKNKLLGLVA